MILQSARFPTPVIINSAKSSTTHLGIINDHGQNGPSAERPSVTTNGRRGSQPNPAGQTKIPCH